MRSTYGDKKKQHNYGNTTVAFWALMFPIKNSSQTGTTNPAPLVGMANKKCSGMNHEEAGQVHSWGGMGGTYHAIHATHPYCAGDPGFSPTSGFPDTCDAWYSKMKLEAALAPISAVEGLGLMWGWSSLAQVVGWGTAMLERRGHQRTPP